MNLSEIKQRWPSRTFIVRETGTSDLDTMLQAASDIHDLLDEIRRRDRLLRKAQDAIERMAEVGEAMAQ